MRRGTSVIDGPPTARPRPGRVTTPMPGPARSSVSGPAAQSTSAVMRAPSVQSGSSPASFTTTHRLGAPVGLDREGDPAPVGQAHLDLGRRLRR